MSTYVNRIIYDASDFVDNPEPRCPVLLLLDTSASMNGRPIQELNAGLLCLKEELAADAMAAKRVELAVVTFGPVRVFSGFRTVDAWHPPTLAPTGDTPLGAAVERGLELLRDRKTHYQKHGVSQFRAWVFLITDGSPTDEWERSAMLVREAVASKSLSFFAVGVENADMEVLAQLAPSAPLKLKELRFRDLFVWLSRSLSSVSRSSPGDRVALPSPVGPDGWGYID